MFTGLVETVGRLAAIEASASGYRLRIQTTLAPALTPGDSLAVNGVCLTVTGVEDDAIGADVGPETARVTTIGSLPPGQPINLERPMRADGRFGGHFVQGHVDGTAAVAAVREDGEAHWLTIALPGALSAYVIEKGAIAVDGVSLTIAALRDTEFDVMIIPFTWRHTTLGALRVRDRVNLECDMVGKYVARAVGIAAAGAAAPDPVRRGAALDRKG